MNTKRQTTRMIDRTETLRPAAVVVLTGALCLCTFAAQHALAQRPAPGDDAALAQESNEHTGKLVAVHENRIEMSIDGQDQHSHRVTEKTRITVNEKPAQISELRPGDRITVSTDAANVALRIEAHRERPQSAAEAAERQSDSATTPPRADDAGRVSLGVMVRASEDEGVVIGDVSPGSPADVADLRPGDKITAADQTQVQSIDELSEIITRQEPGDELQITFERDGQRRQATVAFRKPRESQFRAQPGDQADRDTDSRRDQPQTSRSRNAAWLGVILGASDDREEGVLIERVYPGGPADEAGIRDGDTLVRINGGEISSPVDASQTIAELAPGKQVEVVVMRNGREQSMDVTLGRRNRFFGTPRMSMPERQAFRFFDGDHESLLMQHEDMSKQHERIERMLRELQDQVQEIQEELRRMNSQQTDR